MGIKTKVLILLNLFVLNVAPCLASKWSLEVQTKDSSVMVFINNDTFSSDYPGWIFTTATKAGFWQAVVDTDAEYLRLSYVNVTCRPMTVEKETNVANYYFFDFGGKKNKRQVQDADILQARDVSESTLEWHLIQSACVYSKEDPEKSETTLYKFEDPYEILQFAIKERQAIKSQDEKTKGKPF